MTLYWVEILNRLVLKKNYLVFRNLSLQTMQVDKQLKNLPNLKVFWDGRLHNSCSPAVL